MKKIKKMKKIQAILTSAILLVSIAASPIQHNSVYAASKPAVEYKIKTTKYTHVVKKGETISNISKKYKISAAAVKKENRLKNNKLKIGQKLKITVQSKVAVPKAAPKTIDPNTYLLDLKQWGVYNNGTHASETTKGLNAALKWANEKGYTTFQVPAGTYLIDKNSEIKMVSNMTFLSDAKTIYQKETNGLHGYTTLDVGPLVHDVIIKGGTFKGDKDSHDYYDGARTWKANTAYKVGDKVKRPNMKADGWGYYYAAVQSGTSGSKEPAWNWTQKSIDNTVVWQPVERNTNEGGEGIVTSGAFNVIIDGVKSENFTGDGLAVGGGNLYFEDLYQGSFEQGSLDDNGQKIADDNTIRTIHPLSLSDSSFNKTHTMVIDNPKNLNWHFDIYFYQGDGSFLNKMANANRGDIVNIPDGAASFNLVYHQASFKNAYLEFWNKVQSKNIVVKNSEFDHNRRQGITVGGGDNVTIQNNYIHDIGGVAPMSGIDVEGGYGLDGYVNSNIHIKGNSFHANQRYDLILYDGHDATVENNSFNWAYVAVSEPFTNATFKNNSFNHGEVFAYHDVHFIGNTMSYGLTHMEGPNVTVDGMIFKDNSNFVTSAAVPNGVSVNNVTMYNSNFSTWVEPITVNNLTMYGGSIGGKAKPGSVINNLKMYNNTGTDLISATYNNALFQAAPGTKAGPHSVVAGEYVFTNSTFNGFGLDITNKDTKLTVKNSTFNVSGDNNAAITVEHAKSVDLEGNTINAKMKYNALFRPSVIMLGNYWTKGDPFEIQTAVIKNNKITTTEGVNGISTVYAGLNAPSYDIEGNSLYNAKLDLKSNDTNINNSLFVKSGSNFVQEKPITLSFENNAIGNSINSIAFSGTTYVGVGSNDSLVTSQDNTNWTKIDAPNPTASFTSVIWNKDQFVAVGNKGVIMTSPDGLNWTLRDSHSTYASFQSVKFLNNEYVAVGWSGTVEVSADGATWTKVALPNNSVDPLNDVAFNGQTFVAIGSFDNIFVSTDGLSWKKAKGGVEATSITSNGKQFVMVGKYGGIATSLDGVNWTKQISSTVNSLQSVVYDGVNFVAVGDNGTVLSSSTGLYWATQFTGSKESMNRINFVNGKFVISNSGTSVITASIQ